MKFLKAMFKVVLTAVVVVLLVGLVSAVAVWFMLRGKPQWYRADLSTPEQRKAAADRVEDKLVRIYNWAGAGHARIVRQRAVTAQPATATTSVAAELATHQPNQPFDVQFTDAELNAFFNKWAEVGSRRETMDQYLEDPRLVLQGDQMILAATVKDLGTVVSMEFQPYIDPQGRLQMNLLQVLGGILPLPDALWANRRRRVESSLQRKLEQEQPSAAISPDGTANSAAATVAMNELLLAMLNREPAQPVAFVPYDARNLSRTVPVKITAVAVKDGTLTMTVLEMTADERAALLQQLQTPLPNQ